MMGKRKSGTCHICQKVVQGTWELHRHIRTHTGETPYKCPHCSKPFSDPSNLRRHIRIHTGEKPFRCTICNQSFNQSASRKKHIARWHKTPEPQPSLIYYQVPVFGIPVVGNIYLMTPYGYLLPIHHV